MATINGPIQQGNLQMAGFFGPEIAGNIDIANFDMNLANEGMNLAEQIIGGGTGSLGGFDVSGLLANEASFSTFANNMQNEFTTQFQPILGNIADYANKVGSQTYSEGLAGKYMSDTGQAIDQQIQASKANLQSFGIGDPSGGAYKGLDQIAGVEKGAAQAGAGEVGRAQARQEAVQARQAAGALGLQVSGQGTNWGNAADYAGGAAASAEVGAMNARANALNAAARFADVAHPGYMPIASGGGGGPNYSGGVPGLNGPDSFGSGASNAPDTLGTSYDTSGDSSSAAKGGAIPERSLTDTSGNDEGTTNFSQDAARGGEIGPFPRKHGAPPNFSAIPELRFAAGGPTTGGWAGQHLSPSGGTQTDDIPARLNADEFVVPRDVAKWKGEEFFHKLIEQSRKARMGVQAKPEDGPPLEGPPAFTSQAIPT